MPHEDTEYPEVNISNGQFTAVKNSILGLLKEDGYDTASADALKDKTLAKTAIASAQDLIGAEIDQANKSLDDPEIGAVCIVTPEDPDGSPQTALTRMVILMAATDRPDSPIASDRLNDTLFCIYGASDDNKQAMEDAGLRQFAPEAVLGYHNDGAFSGDDVYVPDVVGLQNVVLNYTEPGRLYFLPLALWDEGPKMLAEYAGATITINTTPIAHREGDTGQVIVDRKELLTVPAIWAGPDGLPRVFLNGDPEPGESKTVFEALQKSLARNPRRCASAQALHRLNLIRNDRGVHARDVLEGGQAHGADYSRVMCRTITSRGVTVPRPAV